MTLALIVFIALILDAIFGEPRWLWSRVPHPIVLMGHLISWADRTFNVNTRASGVLVTGMLVVLGAVAGIALQQLGPVVEILGIAILLAQRSLAQHVSRVGAELRQSLTGGRNAVAMIVSRNTEEMERADVARAAIESGAENLSDGVIAPAFWALIGGLPGILIYKLINTADSMIGYRTARHERFGWAAARLDDVLNWLPARLTCGLLWLVGGLHGRWGDITAEARRHKSPNAGWPEAALARNLDVALAGPRIYHGALVDLPWVNATGQRDIGAAEIDASVQHLWRAWAVFVILLPALAFLT